MIIIFAGHENPDPPHPRLRIQVRMLAHPLLPYHTQEQWPGTRHDGDVWKYPIPIGALQAFHDPEEERVLRNGPHDIVGYTRGHSPAHERGVAEQRV